MGIGENTATVREDVCAGLEFLGVKFSSKANKISLFTSISIT